MRESYEMQNDLDFQALYMYKDDTIFDMQQVALTLSVFESIDKPFLTGEFAFIDNNRLMKNFDIREGCYIVGAFRTPIPRNVKNNLGSSFPTSETESVSVVIFRVMGIKERTRHPTQNGEYVVLSLASPSAFLDQISMSSTSIKGEGTRPAIQLAERFYYDRNNPAATGMPNLTDRDLVQEYEQRGVSFVDDRYAFIKQYNLSETQTPIRQCFHFQRPSSMINNTIQHLVSVSGDPDYLMWETLTGFKISSVQSLFNSPPIINYVKQLSNSKFEEEIDERLASFFSIQELTCVNNCRRDAQLTNGAFNSELYEFDITTKNLTKLNYQYTRDNPYQSTPNRFPVIGTSKYVSEKTTPSKVYSMDVGSFRFDDGGSPNPEIYIDATDDQKQRSQSALFGDTTLQITVAGNHMVETGRSVQVTLPPTGSVGTESEQFDSELSGTYVVRHIGHLFEFMQGTHKMTLELARNHRTSPTSIVKIGAEA